MAIQGLLLINEPSIGLTDRSNYLHIGDGTKTQFRNMIKQRGTASIELSILAGDNYQPTIGSPVYLYDINATGQGFCVFAGTIDTIDTKWIGNAGYRLVTINCVSFEQCFDVIRVPPQLFTNQTCDQIFWILFGLVGTPPNWMQATAYIPGMRVLDPSGHSQLCLTGGTSAGSTPSWNDSGGVTLDGSSTPQQLTWQDLGILNMAPVVLQTPYQLPGLQPATQVSQMFVSDYPTVADVFDQLATIAEFVWGVSTSGYGLGGVDVSAGMVLLTNWQGVWRASHAFAQGATILDSNGHIQEATTGGTTAGRVPAWSTTGGSVVDGSVHWTDQGAQCTSYFSQPSTFPTPNPPWAPDGQMTEWDELRDQVALKNERHDYRNRQYVKMATDTLGRSAELFVGAGQSSFSLMRSVASITNAWLTYNTQNTAAGTLSGQPSPGDTLTIGYPSSGSIYNWAPNAQYQVGQIIVDNNTPPHIQQVTTSTAIGNAYGLSGGTIPTFLTNGGYTVDNQLRWQDEGQVNFGPYLQGVYTFVAVLDNTQWGQVLIGATAYATLSNLIDAINSNAYTQGLVFSLPTWENSLVNAVGLPGTTWAASYAFPLNFELVDSAGHVQKVTNIGSSPHKSASSGPPSFNHSGSTVTDGNLTWTDQGTTIPFSITNKYAGAGFISTLTASTTGSVLKFGGLTTKNTSGGLTQNGAPYTPPGQSNTVTGTTSLAFGNANAQVTGIGFTPGSNVITIWSPLNNGGPNLAIEYHSVYADLTAVENTALVTAEAAIEHGTGKYQAYVSADNLQQGGPGQALLLAQQALAAFDTIPSTFEFSTLRPGLWANQAIAVDWAYPYGPTIRGYTGPQLAFGAVLGGRLIVPPNDGTVRVYSINWEDLPFPNAPGGPSFGNGTVLVKFDGAGGCQMSYQGVLQFTLYSSGFGTNGTQYLHTGPSGAITGTGAIPGSTAYVSVASGDIPAPGNEMQVQMYVPSSPIMYTWVTGPASNNPDGCVHAYLTGPGAGWVIQEITGEMIPTYQALTKAETPSGLGRYRYTVRCINIAQIGSYLDFWEALGGGGGSINSTPTYAGGSGSGASPSYSPGSAAGAGILTVEVNGTPEPSEQALNLIEGANVTIIGADNPGAGRTDVTIAAGVTVDVNGSTTGTEPAINLIASGSNITITGVDNPGSGRVDVSIAVTVPNINSDVIHTILTPPGLGSWSWVPGSQGTATLGSPTSTDLVLFAPTDGVSTKYMRMVTVPISPPGSQYTVIGALQGFVLDTSASGFGICVGGVAPTSNVWAASTVYTLGQQIVDTNNNLQQITTAGTSKSGSHPTWNATLGGTTADNTAVWTNEGPATAFITVENQINRWVVKYQNNYQYTKSTPTTVGSNVTPQTVWFMIVDDGTNITISLGQFNTDWVQIFQQPRLAFLVSTANSAGFFVQPGASYNATATLSSWQVTYP